MKLMYSLLLAAILLLAGCKQDLQVTVPQYVNTPVVYGLLSLHENAFPTGPNVHYIRIQKGYLLKGNAYLAAGIADSIYYPANALVVKLIGSRGYDSVTLNRIDGASVGLNKDTGIFANSPNYLYTFNHALDSNETYTLRITGPNYADTIATSTTGMVSAINIFYPNLNGDSTIAFSNTPGQEAIVSWGIGNNSGVYDLTIRFEYKEYQSASNTLLRDTFAVIPIFTSYIPVVNGTTATFSIPASFITNYLANHVEVNPNLYRQFVSMQFNLSAGGTSLAGYFTSQQEQSGLTSSNALPPFTNITGGYGLFSSRETRVVSNLHLGSAGLDSLACGPTTTNLNFLGRSGHVCN